MAETVTFTSAIMKSFSRDHSGCTVVFSSAMNQHVSKAMKWDEVSECFTSVKLEGELTATTMELTPKEAELKKHKISLDINRVVAFEAVRLELEGKKDKGHRIELRFKVKTPAHNAAKLLEAYMTTIGEGKSSLAVSYTKQETLIPDDVTASEEQKQGALSA